jgi:hypothetical protein
MLVMHGSRAFGTLALAAMDDDGARCGTKLQLALAAAAAGQPTSGVAWCPALGVAVCRPIRDDSSEIKREIGVCL